MIAKEYIVTVSTTFEMEVKRNRPKLQRDCPAPFKGKTLIFQRCEEVNKKVSLYWNVSDGALETLLVGKLTDGWVGLGWGYRRMHRSNSVVAFKDATGVGQADDYFARHKRSSAVQPKNLQNLARLEPYATPDTISVLFARSIASPGNDVPAINDTGVNPFIWAYGPRVSSRTNLREHSAKGTRFVDFRTPGIKTVAVDSYGPFFQAHGLMMAIAWVVLVPVAVLMMRFFKKLNPVTFHIHRALNAVAVVVAVVAYIMGLSRGSHKQLAHLAIGTIVVSLALVQAVSGTMRPEKRRRTRQVWFLLHAYPGRIALCLAILNTYFGLYIYGVRWHWYFILTAVVVAFCVAVLLFTLSPSKFPIVDEERRDLNGNVDIEDEHSSDDG